MTSLKTVFSAFTAVLIAALALPASAQTMKPGLWEVTSKMGGSAEMDQAMAQMQQQRANMPPAQRKMMDDMLAKQGIGAGSGVGGFSAKLCITKEMAERNEMPMQHRGDCKTTISDKSSKGMKMAYTCTNPPSSGDGQFTFNGDSAYTMKMNINSSVQGKSQAMTLDGSGKFLGADCGAVKPIAMPPAGK